MQKRTRGMTLVELLVATALTLVLVAAIAEAFAMVTNTISANRATIELAGRVRQATVRLQEDLGVQTVPMLPWTLRSAGLGYFEYVEGFASDVDSDGDGIADVDTSKGDSDDVIMFTARSSGELFRGGVLGTLVWVGNHYQLVYKPGAPEITPITSELAEIVWFTYPTNEGVRLYRRVLLIRPDIEIPFPSGLNGLADEDFSSANDLSVRKEYINNSWVRVTNSLADLTRREARFMHVPAEVIAETVTMPSLVPPTVTVQYDRKFPNPLERSKLLPKKDVELPGADGILGTPDDFVYGASGTDVMASQVLAFDVRAYDPMAPVVRGTVRVDDGSGTPVLANEALSPGDPGYSIVVASNPVVIGRGAYVDLGYAANIPGFPGSSFSGRPSDGSQLLQTFTSMAVARDVVKGFTYCTWTLSYENDGLDQDLKLAVSGPPIHERRRGADQGTNGLDDDSQNGVDDAGERETVPPYNVALRGIQIRLRVVDPDSRQVRQMTIVSDFLPE